MDPLREDPHLGDDGMPAGALMLSFEAHADVS